MTFGKKYMRQSSASTGGIFRVCCGVLLMMLSCTMKPDNQPENPPVVGDAVLDTPQQDAGHVEFDTLMLNDHQFIQILKGGMFNCLLSMQGDTIVQSEDYYASIQLIDIDEDGYIDIRVFAFSNTPNQCDSYLFDQMSSSFKLIENCHLDIMKVRGTNFYYSYNGAGCGDLTWESNLVRIENYALVNFGYMHGQGCDFEIERNPQVISIYKVNNSIADQKTLIKKLSYQEHIRESDDKWSFIESYWTANYKIFES